MGKSEIGQMAPCVHCGEQIETTGNRTYQKGTGWFPKRKSAKGSHSATFVVFAYEFACAECIHKLSHGIPVGQMSLFVVSNDE